MLNREEAVKLIQDTIQKNDIVVLMKGTPDFPMCGFSGQVISIFRHFGKKPVGLNILEDETLRQTAKELSNWPTFPQIFVKGEFIGGCDIATEMSQSGELEKLLKEKGV